MKQYVFLFSCIITLLLSACSLPHQDTTLQESINTSGQQIQGQEHIPDWIQKGYTGAIAVITEVNSGDIVVQTGDQLLYRNEVYGFQILLGKETKSSEIRILRDTILRSWDYNMSDNEGNSHLKKEALLGITAMGTGMYENMTGIGAFGIPQKELLEDNIIAKNSHYYFILNFYTNTDHGEISDNLPYLECSPIKIGTYISKDCGNRGERLLAKNFSPFDI